MVKFKELLRGNQITSSRLKSGSLRVDRRTFLKMAGMTAAGALVPPELAVPTRGSFSGIVAVFTDEPSDIDSFNDGLDQFPEESSVTLATPTPQDQISEEESIFDQITKNYMIKTLRENGYEGPWSINDILENYKRLILPSPTPFPPTATPFPSPTPAEFPLPKPKPPEFLPTDVLSTEELRKINVYIIRTPSVGLLIRKHALEEELIFRKAKEYAEKYETNPYDPYFKLNIVLVDDESLNMSSSIPPHLRTIYEDGLLSLLRGGITGNIAGFINHKIHWNNSSESDVKDKQTNKILKGRDAKHHEWAIFLAAGGRFKPKITDSMPGPERLSTDPPELVLDKEYQLSKKRIYIPKSTRFLGFSLMHELLHFSDIDDFNRDELNADITTFAHLLAAYEEARTTGNISKYRYIFTIPEGFILTNNKSRLV